MQLKLVVWKALDTKQTPSCEWNERLQSKVFENKVSRCEMQKRYERMTSLRTTTCRTSSFWTPQEFSKAEPWHASLLWLVAVVYGAASADCFVKPRSPRGLCEQTMAARKVSEVGHQVTIGFGSVPALKFEYLFNAFGLVVRVLVPLAIAIPRFVFLGFPPNVFHSPDFAKWQRCLLQVSSTYITAFFHMASPF